MNANELADKLLGSLTMEYDCDKYMEQAATMLRQQQAEIEALRNQLWDLKSEPWGFDRHPVKELTDEEIRHIQAICHLKDVGYDNFIMRFARAILRKAQEK
jgi:hypothetical protein